MLLVKSCQILGAEVDYLVDPSEPPLPDQASVRPSDFITSIAFGHLWSSICRYGCVRELWDGEVIHDYLLQLADVVQSCGEAVAVFICLICCPDLSRVCGYAGYRMANAKKQLSGGSAIWTAGCLL